MDTRLKVSRLAHMAGMTLTLLFGLTGCRSDPDTPTPMPTIPTSNSSKRIDLPAPREQGERSLEETIASRRSVRRFSDQSLTPEQLSQLLWAAQGITDPRGFRAAPSAGALYPLELYVASAEGLDHYRPAHHDLIRVAQGDLRPAVWEAGLKQEPLRQAPAVFIFCAVYARTAGKYGPRAAQYVHLEAGHAAQNLLLQAVALGLGGVPIGAFYEEQLQADLGLPEDHQPLYLLPIGQPAE